LKPARPPKTAPPRAGAWSRRRTIVATLIVALFATALYLPTLRNGFVWDDIYMVGNPDVHTLNTASVKRIFTSNFWEVIESQSGMYRPLTVLTFLTDYHAHGENAGAFHLTNTILNAVVCALVFLVLLALFDAPLLAMLAALLFAAFPMHVENVAWVSGRTDIIATLFMLASLLCHAIWRRKGGVILPVIAWLCLALALLGKELAIVLPGVIVLYELLVPRADYEKPAPRLRGWPTVAGMVVIAGVYLAVRRRLFGSSLIFFARFTHGAAQAVAFTFSIVAHYTYKLLWPFRLNAESDFYPPASFFNVHTLVGIVVVTLTVFSLVRWRRHRAVVFAIAVLACGLAPVLNILPLNQVLAERFLYFPSIGWVLLVALLVMRAVAWRRMPVLVAFCALLVACSARTITRTFDWKDEMTLFQKTVETAGDNPRARGNLGVTLYQKERYQESLEQFQKAVALRPDYAAAWHGMGRTEAKMGHSAEALQDVSRAVELAPDNAVYVNSLGIMQMQNRMWADAAQSFRRVLELRPRHLHARFNLGLALYQQRDFAGAVRELSAIVDKDPEFVNGWFFIAEAESQEGNTVASMQAATKFLSLHTTDDAIAQQARKLAAGVQ
jgi:tetratricopeptide (TPR) repeat protein